MTDLPDLITRGSEARLFPVLAETSKEKRVASIFLAVLTQIPELSAQVFSSVGQSVGKQARVRAFTEVVLKKPISEGCRPDGLLLIEKGKRRWSALIEAKVGKSRLCQDQVRKYLEIARENEIDAVITISNEFVSSASHSPVSVPRPLLKRVDLYHWSWSWIATLCEIIAYQETVIDDEQDFLLRQLNHFLAHPATGVERFNQMCSEWRGLCQSIRNDEKLKKNSKEVEAVASAWMAEEQDLCLHMSRHVGEKVVLKTDRKAAEDPSLRHKSLAECLVNESCLSSTILVPNCASDIKVSGDVARRTISVSMELKAPGDRKSTKARVNWLLRMLPEDDERILIRAHWPGRGGPTQKDLLSLRNNPMALQNDNPTLSPHKFEVVFVEDLAQRFWGNKTFIEDLERVVPDFYDLVACNLKSWQAAPPKPIRPRLDENLDEED